MAEGRYVAYYRVSTQTQGRSGLGLEAQRAAVSGYLNGGRWEVLEEFVEVETGKGADALSKRPQLRAALDLCKRKRATLIIAKLDRLARNVHFITGLMESKVNFVAVDMPHANKLTVHILAAVAEDERDRISTRTREALAAAKARGVKLGRAGSANLAKVNRDRRTEASERAASLRATLSGLRAQGMTQREIVAELNRLGVRTARGGRWHLQTLQRTLARLEG